VGNGGVWLVLVLPNGEVDLASNDEAVSFRRNSSVVLCEEYTFDHEECQGMHPLTMCYQSVCEMLFESYCSLHDWCNVFHFCSGEAVSMQLHGGDPKI